MPKNATSPAEVPEVQFAAGGIVWKQEAGVLKVALVHRPKYDDWALPKGKPDKGETIAETALREVREELACAVRFLDFAGVVHYPLKPNRTKVVLFWHMAAAGESHFKPNEEIDEVLWLPVREALRKLSHVVEMELLDRVGEAPPPLRA